jgi:hypothetical protein
MAVSTYQSRQRRTIARGNSFQAPYSPIHFLNGVRGTACRRSCSRPIHLRKSEYDKRCLRLLPSLESSILKMAWTSNYLTTPYPASLPNPPTTHYGDASSCGDSTQPQSWMPEDHEAQTSLNNQPAVYSSAPSCSAQSARAPAPLWHRRNSQSTTAAGLRQKPEMSLPLPQIIVSPAYGSLTLSTVLGPPALYPAQGPPTVLVPSGLRPWDPIVDMHLAQEKCRSTGSLFADVQSHAPQASGSGYLPAYEENPFDALDVENPAGASPWTMSWKVEPNGVDATQATLHVRLFCEDILRETIVMETSSSIVGSKAWNLALLTRLGVARTCINIRALSADPASLRESMKEEDCQGFADEIIFALTQTAVPVPGT